jgi:hypothetical protein
LSTPIPPIHLSPPRPGLSQPSTTPTSNKAMPI